VDTLARHPPSGRGEMPDLLDRITHDIQRRLEELLPLVREAERLEAALTALGANRAISPSSATPTARAQPSARAAPTGRRRTRRPRQPTAGPAGSSSATHTRRRAPRGQNRERVLGVLRARPGATAAEVASVGRTAKHRVRGAAQAGSRRRREGTGAAQRHQRLGHPSERSASAYLSGIRGRERATGRRATSSGRGSCDPRRRRRCERKRHAAHPGEGG
jgi:hypothetical protein